MFKNRKILIIIPARGGSKRIPHKNIKIFNGRPLIAHAINAALRSKYWDKIIVSTDSPAIARIARKYGAEVPFTRPAHLATDTASSASVLKHAVSFYSSGEFSPDVIVLIQPTSPLVLPEHINGVIRKMFSDKTSSCFSACEIAERPEWMYKIRGGRPTRFLNLKHGRSKRSQDLPRLFRVNGAVYAVEKELLMKKGKIIGHHPSIFIMPRENSIDIDEPVDLKMAEALAAHTP